jgi:uncharacterized LabA/DUF88 family protein
MRNHRSDKDHARTDENRAAVLVDYENLFELLGARLDNRDLPDELITEILDELRRYLLEEDRAKVALVTAYADFSELRGNGQFIQRTLCIQGAEPRFVPTSLQNNGVELRLCIDAMELVHRRPDIRTFVIVTGDHFYLPLIRQLKASGRHVLLVGAEYPPATDGVQFYDSDYFVDALNLLSEPSRRQWLGAGGRRRIVRETVEPTEEGGEPVKLERVAQITYQPIASPEAIRTLEVIEEYFGQYEEVYLTPLLRKLSEVLNDEEHDPKTIISDLEEAGAVWLEKRRGFPYDYTVLLVDSDHPDVRLIQEAFYERDLAEEDEEEDEEDAEYVEEEEEEEEDVDDEYVEETDSEEYIEEFAENEDRYDEPEWDEEQR